MLIYSAVQLCRAGQFIDFGISERVEECRRAVSHAIIHIIHVSTNSKWRRKREVIQLSRGEIDNLKVQDKIV